MAKTHVIGGVTYVEVNRKAKIGDKKILTDGTTLTAVELYDRGEGQLPGMYFADSNGTKLPYFNRGGYPILEPLESEEVTVDTSQASEQVIEMLANLARRVMELESENARITKDLGWHEMGPGRIANLRNSVRELTHMAGKLECDLEQERHENDAWAVVLDNRVTSLERQLADTQRNLETFAEQTENNSEDIRTLDERTQPKESKSETVTLPKWFMQAITKPDGDLR